MADSTKVPMAFAAQTLAQICDEVDSADKIDALLQTAFDDAKLDLGESVDRRIAFDRWVKIQVEAAEEGYRYYRDRKSLLEQVHARFKERTKAIIEAEPGMEDAFRGRLGKISLCNSPTVVEYSFGSREVTPEVAEMFGVDQAYLLPKVVYKIDAARVKQELELGEALPWATLKTSKHIRFPANRSPKPAQIEGEGK